MATTIQVSEELLDELKIRKISDKESYEEIIWDLIVWNYLTKRKEKSKKQEKK